jgi:thiol-disulfide isomerase/thioredoxin
MLTVPHVLLARHDGIPTPASNKRIRPKSYSTFQHSWPGRMFMSNAKLHWALISILTPMMVTALSRPARAQASLPPQGEGAVSFVLQEQNFKFQTVPALGYAALGVSAAVGAQTLQNFEGLAAPRLENGIRIGPGMPGPNELKGKVVLIFFWAHWCSNCKAQGPILDRFLEKYRSQGLVIVGPTRLYGYVSDGRAAAPDKELPYIVRVRDTYYPFLRQAPTPVGVANHKRYGVDAVPTLVVVDRAGIVRLYRAGQMTEDALESALRPLFSTGVFP